MKIFSTEIDRRKFLKTSLAGATGLIVGFYLPGRNEEALAADPSPADLNAFIHISPENVVTILVGKSEMGQGVATAVPMLIAEELECDWKGIRFEFAPAAPAYFNPAMHAQLTGGSTSMRTCWEPMRTAGATARQMLIEAAARKWGVSASDCHAENSEVIHNGTKQRVSYGSVAKAASKIPVPTGVKLKNYKEFTIIGKPLKRLDAQSKATGRAEFGIDVRRPGMYYAAVLRCPVFGGKVASFDATKAKKVPGVKDVFPISTGIAVVADNTWNAFQGRSAVDVKWDEGPNANVSTESIFASFSKALETPGVAAKKTGDAASSYSSAAKKVEAEYRAPYEAHATMEPMDCTAHVREDGADVWVPTQAQTATQAAAAKVAGVAPEKVNVHTTFLGGGFGRRGVTDFVTEACEISKAIKGPVQLNWSRPDDTQHDFYRPASLIRMSAGLDSSGKLVSFTAQIACDSVMRWAFGRMPKNRMDATSVDGFSDFPYDVPNILVDYQLVTGPIPLGFWRSVGCSQNGFFRECFMDELAAAAKKDPYEFRRDLLKNSPRNLQVLNLVAEKAGWGKPLPAGRYRGIAVVAAFETYAAEVAEISLDSDKNVTVHRVVAVVDVGQPINPSIIEQQVHGGIVYGLSQGLKGHITIAKGRVQQANFNTFEVLRMNEMPQVEVHVVNTHRAPTGMGEPAVPPVTPAVFNAIYAATGKRLRRMPFRAEDLA